MTYPEFERAWLGKRVDYDAAYGYQCVDLVKQYMAQVYGLKPGTWGNAIDYWKSTNANILTKFDKVAGSAAKQGDVVVINGTAGNPYGHIGIATGAIDGTNVEILEQNGSTGNGSGTAGDAIRKRFVARSRVAGLLRPKGQDVITATDKSLLERLTVRLKLWSPGFDGNKEIQAWTGQDWRKFLDHGMNESEAQWNANQAKINGYNALAEQVAQLSSRPTKEQLQAVVDQLNASQAKVTELEKAVTEVKPVDEKAVVEGWLKKLWNKLFN